MTEFKPTVMPKEEPKQQTLGEAGIQLPKDPHQIKAFEEVRNVDAKDLNAKLQAQDAAKSSATPGIQIPKDAENIQALKDVRDVDAKDLNAKLQK